MSLNAFISKAILSSNILVLGMNFPGFDFLKNKLDVILIIWGSLETIKLMFENTIIKLVSKEVSYRINSCYIKKYLFLLIIKLNLSFIPYTPLFLIQIYF